MMALSATDRMGCALSKYFQILYFVIPWSHGNCGQFAARQTKQIRFSVQGMARKNSTHHFIPTFHGRINNQLLFFSSEHLFLKTQLSRQYQGGSIMKIKVRFVPTKENYSTQKCLQYH